VPAYQRILQGSGDVTQRRFFDTRTFARKAVAAA